MLAYFSIHTPTLVPQWDTEPWGIKAHKQQLKMTGIHSVQSSSNICNTWAPARLWPMLRVRCELCHRGKCSSLPSGEITCKGCTFTCNTLWTLWMQLCPDLRFPEPPQEIKCQFSSLGYFDDRISFAQQLPFVWTLREQRSNGNITRSLRKTQSFFPLFFVWIFEIVNTFCSFSFPGHHTDSCRSPGTAANRQRTR